MLVIVATRYDAVTERTFSIATLLHRTVTSRDVESRTFFENDAIDSVFFGSEIQRSTVVAFFGHGNEDGVLMTQTGEPCWSDERPPIFPDSAVLVVHACRGMKWLDGQFDALAVRALFGYSVDLITPVLGASRFWDAYSEIHSNIAYQLTMGVEIQNVRIAHYELCTSKFDGLKNDPDVGLIELIAIQQSRDNLEFRHR